MTRFLTSLVIRVIQIKIMNKQYNTYEEHRNKWWHKKWMPDSLTSGAGLNGRGQLFETLLCRYSSHKPGNPVSLHTFRSTVNYEWTEVGVWEQSGDNTQGLITLQTSDMERLGCLTCLFINLVAIRNLQKNFSPWAQTEFHERCFWNMLLSGDMLRGRVANIYWALCCVFSFIAHDSPFG